MNSTVTDLQGIEKKFGANNYNPLDVVLARGQGAWLWDIDGKRYLDCLSAYSAVNQGHCHPRIVETLQKQAERLTLVSRAFRDENLAPFLEEIHGLTGMARALPMNTGVEAVETGLKLARKWGEKVKGVAPDQGEIIVCQNNFHGRTIAVIGFSSEPTTREGFGPFPAGFVSIPFGDTAALETAITPNTVGFLFEPIQGEGGVRIPPDGFMARARELCTAHNVLLIADEVQTGLGRTGYKLALDYEKTTADIVLLGKSLGGGVYPVSAALARDEVMDCLAPGQHGSTFGGNPMATAVGRTALQVIREEGLIENAAEQGRYLLQALKEFRTNSIAEVRGRGLMIAVEFQPEAGGARSYVEALRNEGILAKETKRNIIRIAPPLILSRDEADWALERFQKVLLNTAEV